MQTPIFGATVCAGVAMCLSIVAFAAAPTSDKSTAKTPAAATTSASSAHMRAYIDPATGKLVSHPVTTEQKLAAQRSLAQPAASVVRSFQHADGSTVDVLHGAANVQIIATIDKHGKLREQCTEAAHEHVPEKVKAKVGARDER